MTANRDTAVQRQQQATSAARAAATQRRRGGQLKRTKAETIGLSVLRPMTKIPIFLGIGLRHPIDRFCWL
jgi:hypothetical protein